MVTFSSSSNKAGLLAIDTSSTVEATEKFVLVSFRRGNSTDVLNNPNTIPCSSLLSKFSGGMVMDTGSSAYVAVGVPV